MMGTFLQISFSFNFFRHSCPVMPGMLRSRNIISGTAQSCTDLFEFLKKFNKLLQSGKQVTFASGTDSLNTCEKIKQSSGSSSTRRISGAAIGKRKIG